MFEYPYFMSAVFAAFIFPQALSLVSHPLGTSPEAIDAVLLMTVLCIMACLLGYRAPESRWIVENFQIPLDDRKLFRWGVFFILCGFFFTYLFTSMSREEQGGNQWTGKSTIYYFFANLGYAGLAICLRQAIRNPRDQIAWFWTIAGLIIPAATSVLGARREPAALFAFTVAMTLFFQTRYVVPRALIVGAIAIAMLVIPATSQVRSTLQRTGVKDVWNVDFIGNFKTFISGATILEFRNAATLIDATQRTGNFGYGRAYWDQLVFRFVPAQIFGRGVKDSLMFRSAVQRDRGDLAILGYKQETGTTLTGIGDAF